MNPNTPAGVNANLQGALWMILAGGAFTISNVAVRSAAEEIHPFVVVFLRSVIAVPLFAHVFLADIPQITFKSEPIVVKHRR